MFTHHPDELIYIDDFVLSLDEFLIEEPAYILPEGMIGRVYIPEENHYYIDKQGYQLPAEFPWEAGDIYLGKKDIYKTNYAERLLSLEPFTASKVLNWQGLTSALRGTALFGKVYAAAKTDLNINVPFTLLTSTLNSANPNLADLQFVLTDLKVSMNDYLTAADITAVNQILEENHFDFKI